MKRRIKLIIIICTLISSICLINTTKSRYLSEANMNGNANVAIPEISLEETESNNYSIIPGNNQYYYFTINNKNGEKINEVSMSYYINLNITKAEIPLTYKLYEYTGTSETELAQTSQGYGPITLDYGTSKNTRYKIVFSWDGADNDKEYAEKQFNFNLSINAIQNV